MNVGKTVFAQLMSFFPEHEFNKCVTKYNGNYKVPSFTCREHFYVMSFAPLTYRESLRDVVTCLKALSGKLYHSGIKQEVSKSTLAEANENRDWRIYADFAQVLIKDARKLDRTDNDFLLDIDNMADTLDSTTIDLCLSLFPWAKFRKKKAAVKTHVLLDLQGSIPAVIEITDGSVHMMPIYWTISPLNPALSILWIGVSRSGQALFHSLQRCLLYSQGKGYTTAKRVYSRSVDKTTGLRCYQSVRFTVCKSKKEYPELMHRIKFLDLETGNTYVFLTNNFKLDALLITRLYKERWKIELFFKWLKQHLRIKIFYDTSYNAVCCQVWISVCTYLLEAIVKKRLNPEYSLYNLLQIFSLTLFEKVTINELFTKNDCKLISSNVDKQLISFDL